MEKELKVKEVGAYLYLDSGTLTPLLKRLEEKGYITRRRSADDERDLIVTLTQKGAALREQALSVPQKLSSCIDLEPEKAKILYELLYEIIGKFN